MTSSQQLYWVSSRWWQDVTQTLLHLAARRSLVDRSEIFRSLDITLHEAPDGDGTDVFIDISYSQILFQLRVPGGDSLTPNLAADQAKLESITVFASTSPSGQPFLLKAHEDQSQIPTETWKYLWGTYQEINSLTTELRNRYPNIQFVRSQEIGNIRNELKSTVDELGAS